MIAAAVYVPLLDGKPVAESGAADGAKGAALADVVADLAALHATIEQMGAAATGHSGNGLCGSCSCGIGGLQGGTDAWSTA